ncbi:MAG: FCD domain-containing protein [Planctomycetaceae bacterium]|nr:FCD domain-containing protein [Planctomycetaceae bacterium]
MASIPANDRAEKEDYLELNIEFHWKIARLSGNAVMASMLCGVLGELKTHLHHSPIGRQSDIRIQTNHTLVFSPPLCKAIARWLRRKRVIICRTRTINS